MSIVIEEAFTVVREPREAFTHETAVRLQVFSARCGAVAVIFGGCVR